jgi:hypothetical protein
MIRSAGASAWTPQRGRRTWHVQKLNRSEASLVRIQEGEEAWPMTHGRKSDSAVVAGKSLKEAEQLAAEPMERGRRLAVTRARSRVALKPCPFVCAFAAIRGQAVKA